MGSDLDAGRDTKDFLVRLPEDLYEEVKRLGETEQFGPRGMGRVIRLALRDFVAKVKAQRQSEK